MPARRRPAVGLGPRGRKLLADLSTPGDSAGRLALIEEAARLADRLDDLDGIIQGKGVLQLLRFRTHVFDDDDLGDRTINVEVQFDNVLAVARQNASTLRTIIATLDAAGAATVAAPAAPAQPAKATTKLDEVRARRAARQSGA